MVKAFPPEAIKAMGEAVPMGRLGQPHEVGNIHGAVISIDGGSAAL
jgi:hypothetical protein